MKRHVSFRSMVAFLCLSAMLLTAPAIAAEAETDAPVVPTVSTTTPNGTAYAWQPGGFYFQAGADRIFMDYFCYELGAPLRTVGKTSCITLSDLEKIYAPDFTVTTAESGAITISHAGVEAVIAVGSTQLSYYGGTATMTVAPFYLDNEVYVPIQDLLCTGFGKVWSELNGYFAVGNTEEFQVTSADIYNLKMFYRGKNVGKSYWTYWNEEVNRLESVVVYIPTTYDPEVPNKMIVQLHGASGNAVTIPDGEYGPDMMYYAEKYGYIVMWPESYCKQGNFGNWVPPAGQKEITEDTDPENPGAYSEGQLADIELSGRNVQCAMDFVMDLWNVAEQNVFCMGISMGGCGTWYQVAFYGDRFAAASPSGAFVEPEFFPWEKVTVPTLYVGGTEDRNGFDLMLEAYDYALSKGANIEQFIAVGGAPHGGEWPMELTATYEFFESHLTEQ